MNAVAFDTHNFVKRLTKAGMPAQQAEALAEEQFRLLESHLASKRDLAETKAGLERDLAETKAELQRVIAETKAEILKWMFGGLLAQTAIIGALIKLL